jgi:hypothetical protein
MNVKLVWKEAVVEYFKLIFQPSPREPEENTNNPRTVRSQHENRHKIPSKIEPIHTRYEVFSVVSIKNMKGPMLF